MIGITKIPEQERYGTPDHQINTSFNSNWAVELSRYVNNYIYAFSNNNFVQIGLDVENIIVGNTWFSFDVTSGKLIQDLTVIETENNIKITKTNVTIDNYPSSGSFLVFTSFKFLPDLDPTRPDVSKIYNMSDSEEWKTQEGFNPFQIGLEYYDGVTIPGWDPTKNLIVLTKLDYLISDNILQWVKLSGDISCVIDGQTYYFQAGGANAVDGYDGGIL